MPYIAEQEECSVLNPSLCGGKWKPTFTESLREPRRPYGACLSETLIPSVCEAELKECGNCARTCLSKVCSAVTCCE